MRLNKWLLLALLPLALFVGLLVPTHALAQTGTYVFDENDTLTSSQFNELESMGSSYATKYNIGVYLLLTDSMSQTGGKVEASARREFARNYYVTKDLGVGTGKNGIIFVIATQSRQYVTVKHFSNSAEDPFSDDSVDVMESRAKDYLKDNEWYEASSEYYTCIGHDADYFVQNGKQWKESSPILFLLKIAATILIPLMVAFGIVRSGKNAMLTARKQTEATNYLDSNSFVLRAERDIFINRTVTSTPIPKHDSDSDSGGGWSDMGGGFSGSSGGDF